MDRRAIGQPVAAVQEREFDQEGEPGHTGTGEFGQSMCCCCCPSGCDDVIVDEHPIRSRHGVDMHFDGVLAVFEIVALLDGRKPVSYTHLTLPTTSRV